MRGQELRREGSTLPLDTPVGAGDEAWTLGGVAEMPHVESPGPAEDAAVMIALGAEQHGTTAL